HSTTDIHALSLHDALPIYRGDGGGTRHRADDRAALSWAVHNERESQLVGEPLQRRARGRWRLPEQSAGVLHQRAGEGADEAPASDRKSTRLNSSHVKISYA